MTKVNFRALDKLLVQPIGMYGSKAEIARFLLAYGVIDASMSALLLLYVKTMLNIYPGPRRCSSLSIPESQNLCYALVFML